jgi:hypothetical protein
MKLRMRRVFVFLFAGLLLFCVPARVAAQTASTAIIVGTVTDPGGAVVPGAQVELVNTATNESRKMQTNDAGQYTFPSVPPGVYTLKVSKAGFATSSVVSQKIDVGKSYTFDVKLELRAGAEVIEVTAEAKAELQTTDAVVGNVIGGVVLSRLPTLGRDASELVTLQPGSTPYDSANTGFGNGGGTIAGARSDQNSVIIDGIDITDNVITGGGNQQPIIPVGVDSVDEFRVGVTNNNATFGRSSGGQIALISKSGGNAFHGTAYWFHQNDNLNANSWELNHTPNADTGEPFTRKSEQRDNRGGVGISGPIRKDKTFFFANYEVRRFFQAFNNTRTVPTSSLRKGVLTFTDCASGQFDAQGNCTGTGNPISYDLATSGFDPRGIGISPTIQQLWNLMPAGNDFNIGDGLNTVGFRFTVPSPLKTDFVSFKLDHNFTEKLHFFGRYMYSRNLQPNGSQIDLRGGKATTPSNSNIRGDGYYGGLEWQPRSNLTNSFRAGFIRARQDFTVIRPRDSAAQLALPGTDSALGTVALAPGLVQTGFLDTVVDVDTQRARHQAIYDSSKQYSDTLTWIKGKHTVVAGADIRWLPTIHDRDDKVIGSLNSLVAGLDADLQFLGGFTSRPPTCASGGPTTNCIRASDVQRWDRLYAASLGLIDNVGILIVRDGNLQPRPLGESLIAKTTLRMYDFFVQDTWRITPSLTLTYGLAYGWQTTPHEQNQQQTFIVNHDAGDAIINGQDYINQKRAAAEQGQIFNPTLAYLPIRDSRRSDVFSVDYGDVAPRISAAWNPNFQSGFLGRMFGNRKTVIRGGYGISYDRVNTVQSVIIPMLGVGFAQTINVVTPACNATGPGGANCGINGTPEASVFRVGVDGSIPVPPVPGAATSPVVPGLIYSEILSFQNDPDFKVGRSHMFDFTVQRELPANMLMEIGYVGRLGRDLPNSINFNSAPYMFKDNASGQTFAQAFDAVATAIRSGGTAADQPWFENQLPGFGDGCGPGGTDISSTACMAAGNRSAFQNANISSLFIGMDIFRLLSGLEPFDNLQVFDLFMRTHRDISNYHALVATLRNRGWHGLQFDMNYTWSKSLDQVGAVQNSASYYATSFNRRVEYGPSLFDRTHVFNALYNYDLPFGKGHRLGGGNAAVNKFIGGWYTAGVFRFSTGVPLVVSRTNQAFGGGSIFGFPNGLIPLQDPGSGVLSTGVHTGVNGSGGFGTAGDPANGGTGINIFSDPEAASKAFRDILLSVDGTTGRSRPLRGFNFWSWDARVGKITSITEKVKVEFSFDFFNALNHPIFEDQAGFGAPLFSLDMNNPATFGVVTAQKIPANRNAGSRWIQFGLRLNF